MPYVMYFVLPELLNVRSERDLRQRETFFDIYLDIPAQCTTFSS